MPGNTAQVVLKADSRQIRKGTDDLRKMQKQGGRVEKGTKRLARSFASMGKAAGVAGAVLAGLFVRSVIKNTIKQEQAVAQLNASLVSTGRFTKEASQALQDHAAALQQVSTFGDESIIVLQSQLLTFKQLGGEVLPRATEAALDLSIKMGGDLKAAAKQLGLALNDPLTGLSRLSLQGISFSESQKAVIKALVNTNQLAKAQGLILEEIESEFGGAAKAARDTLGGALDTLKNNFGDLLEVTDGRDGVTASINELAAALADPDVKEGFQTLALGALEFLTIMAKLPSVIGFVKDEFRELFGIIGNDDFVRRDGEIADLEEQLLSSRESASAWFRTEDNIFTARATSLEREIALKKELLQADRDAAGTRTAASSGGGDPAARVAATLSAVDTGPTGPTEAEINARAKAREAILKDAARATDALRQSLRELAEETGGDVVVANNKLADSLAAVTENEKALRAALLEGADLTLQQQSDLQDAREGAIQSHQREIQLIKDEAAELAALLTPAEEVLASLELEIELQGLSNVERAKRIALLHADTDASTEAGQAIVVAMDRIAANDEVIEALDAFRSSASDALVDFADGSRSAKDAFGDFIDTLRTRLLRMIAENLIEKALGGFGSTGGGQVGGGIAGIFASIFGGGRAHGGPVFPGKLHPVTELGKPEILDVGKDRFLLSPQGGNVTPISQGRNSTTNITVNLPPQIRRTTAQQMAQRINQEQRRASARNR